MTSGQLDAFLTSGTSPTTTLDDDARQAGYDLVLHQGITTWGDEAFPFHRQYLASRGMTVPTPAVQYSFIQGMREGQAVLAQRTSHIDHAVLSARRERRLQSAKAKAAARRAEALAAAYEDALARQDTAAASQYEAATWGAMAQALDAEFAYRTHADDRAWDAQTRYSHVRFETTVPDEVYIEQVTNDPVTHTLDIQGIPVAVPAVVDVVKETYGNSIEGTIEHLSKQEARDGADSVRMWPITEDEKCATTTTAWTAADPADIWADGMAVEADLFADLDDALSIRSADKRYYAVRAILNKTTGVPEFDERLYAQVSKRWPEFFDRQDATIAGNRRKGNRKAGRHEWEEDA